WAPQAPLPAPVESTEPPVRWRASASRCCPCGLNRKEKKMPVRSDPGPWKRAGQPTAVLLGCLLVILTGISVGPSAAARGVTVKMTVDGTERTALVFPGKDAANTPSPLVFYLDRKSTRLNSSHQIISYA